jgi:hypothetical protein
MAWGKKIPTMTIKPGGKGGVISVTKAPGARGGPGASLTMPHPTPQHLANHVAQVFGPQKPAKASSVQAGTPRSARDAGGGAAMQPSPAMAQIASSMSGD